jgi:hypothetical protein
MQTAITHPGILGFEDDGGETGFPPRLLDLQVVTELLHRNLTVGDALGADAAVSRSRAL